MRTMFDFVLFCVLLCIRLHVRFYLCLSVFFVLSVPYLYLFMRFLRVSNIFD